MNGDADGAIEALARSMRYGSGNREWIGHDPDFDGLRADPRFQRLLEATPSP